MSFVFGVIVGFLLAVLFGIAIVARDMDAKGLATSNVGPKTKPLFCRR